LAVVCIGLGVVLFTTKKSATEEKAKDTDKIYTFSNNWVKTSSDLDEQRQVNVQLTGDLSNRNENIAVLTNKLTETVTTLTQTEEYLKAARDEAARNAAKIADLESQNQALDKQALDLSNTITNLSLAIAETQRKLATSEGDKAFLQKELTRLMAEKAELERQFNDLVVLRDQVRKLKEELGISKRLEWIRKGLFGDEKGAERMMKLNAASRNASAAQAETNHYDLNVEVNQDGTVRVIAPLTNRPAGATQ
jgi:chromosome segregation ATPase